MKIDFNRLKIFTLVFMNGSISKAAQTLEISQPAVSQHIKKLEQELRIPLFTRTNRRLVPTPAAIRLYQRTSPFIAELENEVKHIRRPLDTPYGLLKIGTSPVLGEHFLPAICNLFRFRFPTVTFDISCHTHQQLLSELALGKCDLILTDVSISQQRADRKKRNVHTYRSKKVMSSEMVLVCSESYAKRNKLEDPSYNHLRDKDFLANRASEEQLFHWFHHHYKQFPYGLNYVLTCDTPQTMLSGILSGLGLGVMPAYMVREYITANRLVVISQNTSQEPHHIYLVGLKKRTATRTESSFSAFLEKELQKHSSSL
ncbi:MAG: LysR family transcriptional regulator [Desulfobulbaceae bacterium]|nr:MAG: LysR family transcriptional regulator [Desulfobulbaceae bacterium]